LGQKPNLLSEKYLKELELVHTDKTRPSGFGGKIKPLGSFKRFMNIWTPNTVLDYGCGKGVMLSYLKELYPQTQFDGYDPAVHMFRERTNKKYDCVYCNDVLEHVEPNCIDNVLYDIDNSSQKYIWLRIDTKPARKRLSNGENAHLIIEDKIWWLKRIKETVKGNIVFNKINSKGKLDIAIEK